MNRIDLSKRLLTVTRRVLAPLGVSIAARTAFLLLGIGLYVLAGYAMIAIPTGATSFWSVSGVIWALVVMSLLKGVARYVEQFVGHFVAFHSLAILRNFFYDRLEPQAPSATEGQDAGDLLNRVTKDIDRVEVFFAHTLGPLVTAIIVPVITLIWAVVATSWIVALALAPFILAAGVVVPVLGAGSTDRAARDLRRDRGVLATHVTDSVQGVREIVAFGAEQRRLDEMSALEARIASSQRTSARWIGVRRGVNQSMLALMVVTVGLVAFQQYSVGAITAPQIGIALGLALGGFGPVTAVEDFMADLDQAFASAARVFAVTDRAPLVADPARPKDCDGRGDIVLNDVSFSYPVVDLSATDGDAQRPEVLHGVGITIEAGKTTAIVGASGSGKSTLASLIARMWDVDSGSISIGGIDVRDLTQERLHDLVASAPQRPYVFNDSIRANLLLAAPDASDEDLVRVAEQVGLAEWIASEPDGMDTGVGEMGERLSGGQRQRLALARALLRDAPITVLDEATSQVDSATESVVLGGIRRATAGRTLIVIAHRISTVTDADRIIVMDSGRVVEEGTYDELLAQGGALASLVAREALV